MHIATTYLLLAAAGLLSATAAVASDGSSAKATTQTGSRPTAAHRPAAPAARPALTTVRLKATPVAPATDVLHERFAVQVSGTITDGDSQPLPGATIWKTNTREVLAVANAHGDFALTLPSNASVGLTCGYEGYQEQQLDLRQPQRQNQLMVMLARQASARRR